MDESYGTFSRRTKRYINSLALKCKIDRVFGMSDFNIASRNINRYDLLVVDLKLSGGSTGYEVINAIRASGYVNDILFYSSDGINALDSIMKEYRMEGVFITERNNRVFMPKIERLIDKTVRRSESVVNIRGIVMDETSEFDTQMQEIIIAACNLMQPNEKKGLKSYVCKLMEEKVKDVQDLAAKYLPKSDWKVSDIIKENDFNSMMKAKVLNKVLNYSANVKIAAAVDSCKGYLPQIYTSGQKLKFVQAYDNEILKFRNMLAHVKTLNTETPTYIGKINGVNYYCTPDFCLQIRSKLITYQDWFDLLCTEITQA